MAAEHRYVLLLDKDRDFIRIFRADSPVRPAGRVLWEGNGLRRTYDAMIRLNRERRPAVLYHVCTAAKGKAIVYRVFKSQTPKHWQTASSHTAYRDALSAARTLREAERARRAEARAAETADRARRKAEEGIMLERLRLAGVKAKRLPRLTEKDIRYLEWLEGRRRIMEEAA